MHDLFGGGEPVEGGQGDVVRQFVDAAREGNVRVAFALSPLDRHDPSYGTPAYQSVFECQLTELLTNYGAIDEIWLWQAPGRPAFDWAAIRDLVRRLQPQALLELANLAPIAVNDVRSIGLSAPPARPRLPRTNRASNLPAARRVHPRRSGLLDSSEWFWHAAEDGQVKTLDDLVGLYLDTVGRNSLLRLNVPPDSAASWPILTSRS